MALVPRKKYGPRYEILNLSAKASAFLSLGENKIETWNIYIQPLLSLFFFLSLIFIYLFMAVLGLCFCARAFSSCGKWGPLFIAVRRPLIIAASLVAEHRLQTHRLSNCGSRA